MIAMLLMCAGIAQTSGAAASQQPDVRFEAIHDYREVTPGGVFTLRKYAPVASSLAVAEDVATYLLAQDTVGAQEMVDAGRVTLVEDYTVVRIIETYHFMAMDKGIYARARIQGGPLANKEIYVSVFLLGQCRLSRPESADAGGGRLDDKQKALIADFNARWRTARRSLSVVPRARRGAAVARKRMSLIAELAKKYDMDAEAARTLVNSHAKP